MKIYPKSIAFAAAVALSLAVGSPASAEPEDTDEVTQQCIRLQSIKQTPVIDNKTILVEMKGNTYKRIDLRNRCSGLKIEGGFSHATSINKLCIQDTLRVLRSGGICMIDKIVNITEEEAIALRKS
ncbi:MAG: hypothetical protein OSB02_05695 [Rhodospirillaceae bacterium]|nr:hypothetical protein [Rhodospirillaceae bacterium]